MNEPAFLPYGRHTVDDDDIAAVTAVLRSDFLTTGPVVDQFEASVARLTGARHAVACSSGTAGLHMAAIALGLGEGDAVIVPTLTFLATANAARYVGAEVVFADVDADTGLLGPEQLAAAMTEASRRGLAVKSVFPVHFAGQALSAEFLREALDAAGRADVTIVEDACHSIGGELTAPVQQPIGSCRSAQMSVFSLHPVKTVAMGEGGVVTTSDAELDRRLRDARNHGMVRDPAKFRNRELGLDADQTPNPWYYEMHEPGFNYRASAIHCGLGLSQMAKIERFVARRRALVAHYDARLKSLAPLVRPLGRRPDCNPAWHLYVARVDFAAAGKSRAKVMRELQAAGIGTQVHYLPVHLQPYYRERYGAQTLPAAEALYASILSLPLFPSMSEAEVDRVVDTLADVIGAKGSTRT